MKTDDMNDLPPPPISADIDLRSFPDMPLDVRALRDSDTAAEVGDAAFRAAVLLWCSAWHQIPAASLPNDDTKLARLAGYGKDLKGWKKVREQALRGFELCSDGRLYHTYMCAKAEHAWKLKKRQSANANARWSGTQPVEKQQNTSSRRNAKRDATTTPNVGSGSDDGRPVGMPSGIPVAMPREERERRDRDSSSSSSSPTARATPKPPAERLTIADEIWDIAGRGKERDRYRMAGKVDDARLVENWLTLGPPEAVLRAAKAVIDKAGTINNLWAYLAKAMPDAMACATAPTSTDRERTLWAARVKAFRTSGTWLPGWGEKPPEPGRSPSPNCQAPPDVIEAVDMEIPPELQRTETDRQRGAAAPPEIQKTDPEPQSPAEVEIGSHPPDEQARMARSYFAKPTLDPKTGQAGPPWIPRPPATRVWFHAGEPPFRPGSLIARDVAVAVCREIGLDPDAEEGRP